MVLWIGWIRGRGAPCKARSRVQAVNSFVPSDGGGWQACAAFPVLDRGPDRKDDGAAPRGVWRRLFNLRSQLEQASMDQHAFQATVRHNL